MPSVNTVASGHVGPAALPGGHQFLPYTDLHFLTTLNRAIHIIQTRIRGHVPCDNAFSSLSGGRTFKAVWDDATIWINFDPSRHQGDFGATRVPANKDITITAFSLAMGRWTTAATLVHELAHTNGASGTTHDAEATLRSCLLKGLEDPTIIGQIIQSSRTRIA